MFRDSDLGKSGVAAAGISYARTWKQKKKMRTMCVLYDLCGLPERESLAGCAPSLAGLAGLSRGKLSITSLVSHGEIRAADGEREVKTTRYVDVVAHRFAVVKPLPLLLLSLLSRPPFDEHECSRCNPEAGATNAATALGPPHHSRHGQDIHAQSMIRRAIDGLCLFVLFAMAPSTKR